MSGQRTVSQFCLISLLLIAGQVYAEETVRICGEPFAPYFYQSDENDQSTVVGVDVDILNSISEITGLKFKFEILPWKRCLNNVENFDKLGLQEIAIDATYNASRAEKYYFAGPLYSADIHLFYSKKKFPDGPIVDENGTVISKVNQMQNFSICGLSGHNYEVYYKKHGIPENVVIHKTSGGLASVLQMISAGRCDVFETQATLVAGATITGNLELPNDMGCVKMDENSPKFYMMISKSSTRAENLLVQIDQAIIGLQELGKLERIEKEAMQGKLSDLVKSNLSCL